jgi:hypothetical protein
MAQIVHGRETEPAFSFSQAAGQRKARLNPFRLGKMRVPGAGGVFRAKGERGPERVGRKRMSRLVVMKKGGGGKVAINPDLVCYVRSATGAFTDIFFEGHQVAVEGTFEEVVALLGVGERRGPGPGEAHGTAFKGFDH